MNFFLWLLVGVATIYGGAWDPGQFEGQPLYCSGYDGHEYYYDDRSPVWVAFDVSLYESGAVRCGDEVVLYFYDGSEMEAVALDAGYLYRYRTAVYPDLPIVVDVPALHAPFEGLARAYAINWSAMERAWDRWEH